MLFYIFGLLSIIGLLYYWFTLKYKYFDNLKVPGPKPKFPFGNTPSSFTQKRNAIYDFDDIYQWMDWFKLWNYALFLHFFREFRGKAPFVGYFEMKTAKIMLIDPEAVKGVMVKNFKNFHDNEFSKMVCNALSYRLKMHEAFFRLTKIKIQSLVETHLCCVEKNGKRSVPR